jgi:hypothetical protein
LILAGIGFGCTLAPLITVTMRHVEPQQAGAASGVLNTIRQLGGVIGAAAVGAILQNRLANQLVVQAQARSENLPPAFRSQFVGGFAQAGNGALEVGPGQSSGAALPSGIPPQLAPQIRQLAHDVFANAFLNAMRPSLAVPIGVLALGIALSSLIVRRKRLDQAASEVTAAA